MGILRDELLSRRYETLFAQRVQQSMSWESTLKYQDWLDRAQKRYLSATKDLAVIRRLGVAAIQVNTGEKQVNTIGGSRPGEGENP